jgi:hypothetical protein
MAEHENWVDVGATEEFVAVPLKRVTAMRHDLAISFGVTR